MIIYFTGGMLNYFAKFTSDDTMLVTGSLENQFIIWRDECGTGYYYNENDGNC